MATFPGRNYAPPNIYTRTLYDNPLQGAIDNLKIPVFIGEGNEYLVQTDLELVRGSSATIDQRIVGEDMTGRAVVSISNTGQTSLGDFDGVLNRIQVRNLPITDGSGRGTVSNSRADVTVTINGLPVVVTQVVGESGLITLAQAPSRGDLVRTSYFFNRTDTLTTDDVSDQVSDESAIVRASVGIKDVNAPTPGTTTLDLHANITGTTGEVIVPANNVLNLVVDGVQTSLALTPKSDYTMQQVANVISAAGIGTLTGSTFVNNHGESTLSLNSDHDLTVLEGSANALLGLVSGTTSTRTKTFYTFQGPIVDGTNGGVTTTDPSHVVVKVAGVQVIPVSVDGASRAVTLAKAPKGGATVTITYWFNSWQDTWDHLAHVNVRSIERTGDVPGGSQYTQEADFILQDDKILWGTAVTVRAGVSTSGSEIFDDTQVTNTLIDDRTFLSEATALLSAQGTPSTTDFLLPFNPTLGNGRSTTLGQTLFQSVSNSRIGVPVNRPDVVDVYWGFSVGDALVRGKVAVVKVEGAVVTLKEPVPVGATVYASFYHNRIEDMEYTLTADIIGPSGVGTYTIQDSNGASIFTPTFDNTTKSGGLTGVTITFPSGSELTPDLHFEGGDGDDFSGPVEEVVTVQFANTTDTPAKYTVSGPAPYAFIPGESDLIAMTINGDTVLPAAGTDLDTISTGGAGVMAHLVSDEISYPDGIDFDAADFEGGNEDLILTLDNDTEITATIEAGANKTVDDWVAALNLAADGELFLHAGLAGGPTLVVLPTSVTNVDVEDYFVGWRIVIGDHALGGASPGEVRTISAYDAATRTATVPALAGACVNNTPIRIYNPDTVAKLKGATRFNGPVDLNVGFRTLSVAFNCTNTAGAATVSGTLGASSYASAGALATALNTAFRGASGDDIETPAAAGSPIALAIVADGLLDGLDFVFEADGDGRITLVPQLPGLSDAGYFTFLPQGATTDDFALLAGFDTGATHDAEQTKLNIGEIAKSYRITLGGVNPHDRLILRNRIHPGGVSQPPHDGLEQCKLVIGAGSGNTKAGLANAAYGEAGHGATVLPASVLARVGFGGGTDTDGEPEVTFYDGTGARPANNVLEFTLDGVPVRVEFVASDSGSVNILGLAAAAGDRVILQIETAIGALPGQPFGNLAAVQAAGIIQAEGAGFRIISQDLHASGRVTIGAGSANSVLGLTEGTVATRTLVTAEILASALNSHRETSLADFLHDFSAINNAAAEFAGQALATVVQDVAARKYLHLVSAGPASSDYGTGSVITLLDATTRSWLFVGTGIDELNNAEARGEAAMNGFFVTSSNSAGSGSSDTSVLNAGTGQDGLIGQTYRDDVTGLTFTILPRGWHDNQAGPWIAYPSGSTFRFDVSATVTTDANLPVRSIPGIEMKVSNTSGISQGDTALVQTYPRGGEEPAIGDIYYTSYVYQKQDFQTKFFTRMSAIEAEYGRIHPDNPVTLAAYLAIINGAVLVGIKQVPREENSNFASLSAYTEAIEELEGVLPGQIKPDMIQLLKGDSTQLFQILKRSNDIQSSIRYRSERTSIIGVEAGTSEESAKALAGQMANDRMRLVYPDMALIDIEEQGRDGSLTTKEHLINGPYLAAMMAGSVVAPSRDVATPWTRRRLIGPKQLARSLDAVQQNQLAVAGITVLEDKPPYIRVRHGLTTDMTSILTKTPTVRQIADHVQQQSRATLDPFIGLKYLPGILSQVEGRLAKMMQTLIKQQIIAIYTGLKASPDPDDPTTATVEAYYQPVFPLLYVILTFHMRSNL